jgi:hypothetical protein
MCTSGAAPGRGGRGGMVSFIAISVMSAMVVRVFWRVREHFCCRVYVKSDTNVLESVDNCKYETIGLLCEGPWADEYLVRKTLSPTPRP